MAIKEGKIEACPKNNCGYHCCDFNQENFIVMFPNELDKAITSGKSMTHLKIIESLPNNSHKVVCKAKNRVICDGGYKPVDCKIYPLFPKGDKTYFLKGRKCPLQSFELHQHKQLVSSYLKNLDFVSYDELIEASKDISLVDYENLKDNYKKDIQF